MDEEMVYRLTAEYTKRRKRKVRIVYSRSYEKIEDYVDFFVSRYKDVHLTVAHFQKTGEERVWNT